jgi:anti-sigma B factor antagonist
VKSGLTITEGMVEGIHVLKLAGFLDGHTFVELERRLDTMFKGGKSRIVLELAGLTYIASAGVGAFINAQHLAKKSGGSLQLANAGSSVQEIFDILGLDAIFTIHPTLPEALKAAKA